MRGVNKVFLIGRLGGNPELRIAQTGKEIVRLSVATNRPVREGEGWSEVAEWHKVVLFDNQARRASERLAKGDAVGVVGELRYRKWTDEDGRRRSVPEVIAQSVAYLGRGAGPRAESEAIDALAQHAVPAAALAAEGEELPF